HTGIAVRYPFLGIDKLPNLVLVAGAFEHLGHRLGEPRPVGLVALLKGEALAVGAVAQDRRIFARAGRTEDVGAQHHAVFHRDRPIPVDLHAVADFGFHGLTTLTIPAFLDSIPQPPGLSTSATQSHIVCTPMVMLSTWQWWWPPSARLNTRSVFCCEPTAS